MNIQTCACHYISLLTPCFFPPVGFCFFAGPLSFASPSLVCLHCLFALFNYQTNMLWHIFLVHRHHSCQHSHIQSGTSFPFQKQLLWQPQKPLHLPLFVINGSTDCCSWSPSTLHSLVWAYISERASARTQEVNKKNDGRLIFHASRNVEKFLINSEIHFLAWVLVIWA